MQIQLKQTEIIAALKQYINAQGINLNGKTVDISFTAGRKESGITADISIEDTGVIPGFTDAADEPAEAEEVVKPVLSVVKSEVVAADAPAVAEPEQAKPQADAAPVVAEKTTSLFT